MSADSDSEEEFEPVGGEVEATGESGEPLLEVENVSVEFETGNVIEQFLRDTTVEAVDDVSLEIGERDVVALVGESGSGKTTLGKTAIGLQRPTEGTIRYRGQDIWEARENPREADIEFNEIRRSLQIIHQDPQSALNASRRVRSILADPLKKWRQELDADDRLETVHRFLEYVDMTPASDYAERFPHQLSGGEKQRVALGRAMLMNPDLILADEAVSALDVSLRVDMMDLMLELQDLFGTSYLFISHDLANARYLAKKTGGKIAIMYLGEIVEIGPPDEVLQNPSHPYTEVLKWSIPPVDPEIAKDVIDERPPVRRIDVPDPADPPSGCKFHTRCQEAREVCTREHPDLFETEHGTQAACFRALDEHEYWDSDPLEDEEEIGFISTDPSESE